MSPVSQDGTTIGARLRALRLWRGMTLAETGGLAGVSAAYLSMLERGLRPLDRRSTISALAAALRVSETELTGGPHLGTDSEQSAPHTMVPALRVALETNSLDDPACESARPLSELTPELDQVGYLWGVGDYSAIGAVLPTLVDELHVYATRDDSRPTAVKALVEACVRATFFAKNLGYTDLAHIAAVRAREAALLLGDPVSIGKATYLRLHATPRGGSWDRTLLAAERAIARLEPHAGEDGAIPVLGQLSLTAAMAAAVLGRPAVMTRWIDLADRLAGSVPDDPARGWQSFSKANVGVWRVSLAVERGEAGDRVLRFATAVDEPRLARTSRLGPFLSDVAKGLARDQRTRADAVTWLRRAEVAAPQRFRNSAAARETVAYLLDRATATAGGRELRGMAARMGVAH